LISKQQFYLESVRRPSTQAVYDEHLQTQNPITRPKTAESPNNAHKTRNAKKKKNTHYNQNPEAPKDQAYGNHKRPKIQADRGQTTN
jgi:hypothetical protein